MSSVPMPRDLSEEAVAEWLHDDYEASARVVGWKTQEFCRVPFADLPVANQQVMLMTARAVRALLREKVRDAVVMTQDDPGHVESVRAANAIVARVLGDHPAGGHEAEGREEAPRG